MSDEDPRHPAEALSDAAAQAIRALNHVTLVTDSITQPSTVYRVLGELYTLAGYLGQAYDQLSRSLADQLDSGALRVDAGTTFAGDPELAVLTARDHLARASEAGQVVYKELTAALVAIDALARP